MGDGVQIDALVEIISHLNVLPGVINNNTKGINKWVFENNCQIVITGLASWILCFISVLFGLFAFYSQWLKKIIPPVYLKFIHNVCGIAAYVVGIASLCLALDYGSFKRFVTKDGKNFALYTIILVTIWSTLEALKSLYTQVKAMIS